MPKNPDLDIPPDNDAHVPWESIDEVEDSGDEPGPQAQSQGDPGLRIASHPALQEPTEPPSTGGGWTLPLLCAGVALIACCALIPQSDANRRLAYERQELSRDLQTVEKQIEVNDSFLKQVGDDPTLAERLAQRQMKVIPQGTRVLELPHEPGGSSMSPFQLVNVPPPPPLPPYKPVGGTLARLCYDAHSRLYLIGIALGMIATGLVMGSTPER